MVEKLVLRLIFFQVLSLSTANHSFTKIQDLFLDHQTDG